MLHMVYLDSTSSPTGAISYPGVHYIVFPWPSDLFTGRGHAMWLLQHASPTEAAHAAFLLSYFGHYGSNHEPQVQWSSLVEFKVKHLLTLRAGVCQRRDWPNPVYYVSSSRAGYSCVVRVNNREYQTPKQHDSELLAKEAAATTAYSIVANFSAHHGQFPGGFASGGVIQGNPVPVGSGRHGRRSDSRHSYESSSGGTYRQYGSRELSVSSGSSSGKSSPEAPWAIPAGDRRANRHQAPEAAVRHHQDSHRRHPEPPRHHHRY